MRDGLVDHVGDDAALGLAESGESFVGVDGDEDPGVAGAVSDVGVYGGDFHWGSCSEPRITLILMIGGIFGW